MLNHVQRTSVSTPRRMAPLPRRPVPSPLQRHNGLVSQAGTVRRGVREATDKMVPCEAKLDLLHSLEVSLTRFSDHEPVLINCSISMTL
jgi:hypothetical protein